MSSSAVEPQPVCHILRISNEILMMILNYLPTADLFNAANSSSWPCYRVVPLSILILDEEDINRHQHSCPYNCLLFSRTCSRIRNLCFERKYFTSIENPADNYGTMKLILRRCYTPQRTQKLRISSKTYPNKAYKSSFSPSMIMDLNPKPANQFVALTHLYLIRQKLDGRLIKHISMFPSSLKVLHLSGCIVMHVREESFWFKNMSEHFSVLEEFDLSYCKFATSHSLLAISKLPQLLKLSFQGCRTFGNSIAYTSIACRYGFPKLKILNINDANIHSSDFISFCNLGTKLEEFYFGQYDNFSEPEHHLITDFIIDAYMPQCINLKVIDMTGSRATNTAVDVFLRSLPNLKLVDAHFTQINAEYIEFAQVLRPELRINITTAPNLLL